MIGRRHYDGRELHLALCEALGYDPRRRGTLRDVREALSDALGAPVSHRRYLELTSPHSPARGMDEVLDWCAVSGIDVIVRHDRPAVFIPRLVVDETEYTEWW